MSSGKYQRDKIGSHGVDRTHADKTKALLSSDLQYWCDKVNIGDGIYISTDMWTFNGMARVDVKAWVVEKYPYYCVVEFFWTTSRDTLIIRRCINYYDIAISSRTGGRIVIDMHNKSIERDMKI